MPFKLKLKKSRQYNVKTKNVFVISVEMLDNTVVECTLTSQSLGKECLASLCQRLGLQQPEFFGLKYLSKYGSLWWVDLERPLKKQLDRYAQDSPTRLQLGVIFFVSDVTLLRDEVTRNFFFLQLKADFVEGHLKCTAEQAVMLAAFSLQAEFSDHDPERHTTEYLTNFAILPKLLITSKEAREELLERVILAHRDLKGLTTSLAEIYYIAECKNLEGYAQQIFSTKDHLGSILYIGASMNGIFLKGSSSQAPASFRWAEIVNLVHHRRHFGIECHERDKSVQCHLEDIDQAKYVWKMCAQQHAAYNNGAPSPQRPHQTRKNTPQHREDRSSIPSYSINQENANQIMASQESLDELGVYHTEEEYVQYADEGGVYRPEDVRITLIDSGARHSEAPPPNDEDAASPLPFRGQQSGLNERHKQGGHQRQSQESNLNSYSSTQHLPQQNTQTLDKSNLSLSSRLVEGGEVLGGSSSSSGGGLQSGHRVFHSSQEINEVPLSSSGVGTLVGSDSQLYPSAESRSTSVSQLVGVYERRVTLPSYRQAPDYETAIRHKYGVQSSSVGDVSVSSGGGGVSGGRLSAMTDSRASLNQGGGGGNGHAPHPYAHYRNYVDLSHIDSDNSIHGSGTPHSQHNHNNNNGLHPMAPYSNLVMQPPAQTWSTPELHTRTNLSREAVPRSANQGNSSSYHHHHPLHHQHHHFNHFNHHVDQSPPAYPFKIQSTPDLTLRHQGPNHHHHPGAGSSAHQVASSASPNRHNALVHRTGSDVTGGSLNSVVIKPPPPYVAPTGPAPALFNGRSGGSGGEAGIVASANQNSGTQNGPPPPSMGPMLVAAMNGLTLSPPDVCGLDNEANPMSRDSRIQLLESRLAEGQFFLEFEQIPKKKPMAEFTTALLAENANRNRFRDVLPYEENRVRLTPTKDNRTGYINASRISVTVGNAQRFYIAAQGPLPNTVHSFWQMVWEQQVSLIVSLTETQENGKEKCHPYWPQSDHAAIRVNEFQISRSFSVSSSTYVTCSLTLNHAPSRSQRSVWHIQYTDWPDHRSPQDLQGFLSFMEEIDAVRRLSVNEAAPGRGRNSPVLVHCSAGVGRSGVTILADIMLYALDNAQETLEMSKLLTQLRYQRMLTIQTLAQYKFVYSVLIQYLKNSRLI